MKKFCFYGILASVRRIMSSFYLEATEGGLYEFTFHKQVLREDNVPYLLIPLTLLELFVLSL